MILSGQQLNKNQTLPLMNADKDDKN